MTDIQPLDTPLWAFTLVVYGSAGVAQECLDLQDSYELDVNLLLFAAYMGASEGVQLSTDDIAAAFDVAAPWNSDVVRTLREARRALVPMSTDEKDPLRPPASSLRAQVKNAELNAEKIEQAMLWTWAQHQFEKRQRGDRDEALAANLTAVLTFYRTDSREEASIPRLREAATRYTRMKH